MQLVVGRQFVLPPQMGQDSLHFCFFARFLLVVARRLQEGPNRLAGDAQADNTARSVDLSDRVGWDQLSPAGEEARADGEGVGNIRSGAVHRALDPTDHAPPDVGDQVTDRPAEVGERGFAHSRDVTPAVSTFFVLPVRSL
jgi:hypothetical protein